MSRRSAPARALIRRRLRLSSRPDLVRGPDGRFRVLEDNLRAPSGLGYLLAARMALEPIARACDLEPKPIEPAIAALGSAILGTAPDGIEAPTVVLLNDGPCSSAAYEHAELARWIGMTIATADDLSRDGDRLLLGGRDTGRCDLQACRRRAPYRC